MKIIKLNRFSKLILKKAHFFGKWAFWKLPVTTGLVRIGF